MPSQHLLLIEDDITLGEMFVSILEDSGHGVRWFVRARLSDGQVILTDADGRQVQLVVADYELALVDYRLKGSPINGPDLIPVLVSSGLPVVGISGLSTLNEELTAAGARTAVVKDELMSRLIHGRIVIDRNFAGLEDAD